MGSLEGVACAECRRLLQENVRKGNAWGEALKRAEAAEADVRRLREHGACLRERAEVAECREKNERAAVVAWLADSPDGSGPDDYADAIERGDHLRKDPAESEPQEIDIEASGATLNDRETELAPGLISDQGAPQPPPGPAPDVCRHCSKPLSGPAGCLHCSGDHALERG